MITEGLAGCYSA